MNNKIKTTEEIIALGENIIIKDKRPIAEFINILVKSGLDSERIQIIISYFQEIQESKKNDSISDRKFWSVIILVGIFFITSTFLYYLSY